MEFMLIFFLFAFATVGANQCSEEEAEKCIENLLQSILGDTTEEEVCRELGTSIDCLQEKVKECEVEDEEALEGLADLERLLIENCEEEDSDEEKHLKACFDENEEYMEECLEEGAAEVLVNLDSVGRVDENALTCSLYNSMTECFVNKIGERCGDEAADLAREEFKDAPKEIAEACEQASNIDILDMELLDKKK